MKRFKSKIWWWVQLVLAIILYGIGCYLTNL